ncbi:MAG TPA: hypothetical protein VE029_05360 [Rhizobacter sp.]|nr:hypothetical protein [Rhizobacter sp.]
MKPKLALFLISLCSLPALCLAQPLYKCGNTYSQTPCAPDATTKRIATGAAPDQPQASHGKDLCASAGVALMQFPDPDSTQLKSVNKAPSEVIQYAGQPVAAHRFDMLINTKNGYGAYTGERLYPCYLSEDEQRVLRVDPPRR